jgi:hypothetical protein
MKMIYHRQHSFAAMVFFITENMDFEGISQMPFNRMFQSVKSNLSIIVISDHE